MICFRDNNIAKCDLKSFKTIDNDESRINSK